MNKLDSFHVRRHYASCTSAGTISCPTMKFCVVPACSTSCTSSVSEDWVSLVTSLDFELVRSDVPANQILQICTKTRDGERPSTDWRRACGRPSTTWTHEICRDTGVTATEALQLAEDRPFSRTIATVGGTGGKLRVMMMMMKIDDDSWQTDGQISDKVKFFPFLPWQHQSFGGKFKLRR